MRRSWKWAVAVIAVLAMFVAGTTASLAATKAKKVTVTSAFAFSPKTVTIAKNHRVKWVNSSTALHHILFTNGAPFNKDVPIGGSVLKVFHHKGTFHYHCTIHTFMKGVVKVT
ncbi:MAG: cupredoxin domain-containing protein [Actinomycetota bacterium]|nr:cupredoxin domain-containing protein [Actinomycetota bacterium]